MRAFRYHDFRPRAAPRIEDIAVPQATSGEVLVHVRYAGVNPVDWKIADGSFRLLMRGGLPRTMGVDFAGEIAAVGSGVDGWSQGDPVLGFVDPFRRAQGSFAEFLPVPASFLHRRPASLDERMAGALPCAGISAVMLCKLGAVGRGARVLVNGASGGVGHLAVQLARARGARVTATASAGRRDFVASLGADDFVDYRSTPREAWPSGFDAVLDCVPNLPRSSHPRLLARRGHYASTLPGAATWTIDPILNRLGRLERHAVMLDPSREAMDELLRCVERGELRCEIAGEYPLDAAAAAIDQSRSGRVAGKLVLRID